MDNSLYSLVKQSAQSPIKSIQRGTTAATTAYSLDTSAIIGNQTMIFRMGCSDATGGTGGYTQYKDIYFELV